MSYDIDRVNLNLPEIKLSARINFRSNNEVECSIEILEHEMLSLNLVDARNHEFFVKFDARLKITFNINGREESIVIFAEEFEVSSEDVIEDSIYLFDFEESTISKDDLYWLVGSETIVSFYTLTE